MEDQRVTKKFGVLTALTRYRECTHHIIYILLVATRVNDVYRHF